MARGKRGREPDEAPEHTNKHHRVQKEPQIPDPVPRPNLRNNNEEEPGRPGPPSNRVSQPGSTHSPPVQLPLEQRDQGARQPKRLKLNPPKPQRQPSPSQAETSDPGSSHSETSTCYSQYVANYDVEPGAEAVGTPEAKDIEYWGSVEGAAKFIRSESGLGKNWVGIRPLGKGGCGIAGLWEMQDDDGQLIKQMVIKEETHTRTAWRKNKSVRKVPGEVKIMSKLNKTHCHAIPRLLVYKRYPHVYKHRIYMEFCPHKDLSVLCKRYGRFRQFLPEPFLWDTFYHLIEAAVAMRDGPEGGGWEFEIVHRDLKPGNIFLGEENTEKGFPFYPVAKTGDFGLAVMTKEDDSSNPDRYRGPGTQGYCAPEQVRDNTPRLERHQLSSYTNVWAIGATMLELLTLYSHQDYMNDPEYNVDGMIIDIKTNKEPEYSEYLRTLIKDCVEPDPLKRIKLDRLRACIKVCRDRLNRIYEESDNNGRARFEYDSLLYYVRNEINNMPTGNWEPFQPESPSKPEHGKFRDGWPVVFPRFDDGPEAEGEGSDDSDDDSDSDDDPEGMLPKNTVNPSSGHRSSNPIVIADDTASEHTDSSDIWRRKDTRKNPGLQLGQGGAAGERSDSGGEGDGGVPSNGRLSHAGAEGAVREDGGIEGLEDSLTDGLQEVAPDGGTDDESQAMESGSDDPVSPPPPAPQAPAHQAPAPAPAPALALAPPPAPAPAAPAPAAQPVPRKLRSGTTFGYF